MKSNIKIPLIARPHWLLRFIPLTVVVLVYVLILINHKTFAQSFGTYNLIVAVGSGIVLILWPALTITTTFFSKTVFEEDGIYRVSPLLVKRKWFYDEISKLETGNETHLKISFVNGGSLKVYKSEADLGIIESILNEKCDWR